MIDKEQRIREVAYFIWQEEGCPDGRAEQHWERAQAIVESQDAERKDIEGETPGETLPEYLTPLSTLKRAPSSGDSQ